MAYPLYGEDYETAQTRNVYLPEGIWIDYDTGKEYTGPQLLSDFEIPVEKTPLFVGGTGIVIEEIEGELKGRIYPVTNKAQTIFFGKDGDTKSVLSIENPDWGNVEIIDLRSPPSNNLHKLHGDRKDQWAISVNGPWRLCFRFKDGDIFDLELVQYH